MRRYAVCMMSVVIAMGVLSGCSQQPGTGGDSKENISQEEVELTVSTVEGSLYFLPFWVTEKKGEFKENNINFKYLGFDGGAVQMEAYESWDIGVTGIGGVLSGTVGHDAVVLGACLTDSATQNFYAAPDSAIVQAGQGKNTVSETVYGDADSWRNAEILSGYGDVKHYCLAKTLEGFGLKIEDVNVLWMDPSTCITSYFGGQGDVAAVYGAMTYNQDVQKLTKVICGNDMELGLMGNLIGNAGSISDPKKYDALKKTMELYYKNLEWIRDNKEEAKKYMEDYYNYIGVEYTDEKAENVLNNEHYYTLEENIKELLIPSAEDGNINVMQKQLADVARFYEGVDVYEAGTAESFLKPEHFNFNIITEIYNGK